MRIGSGVLTDAWTIVEFSSGTSLGSERGEKAPVMRSTVPFVMDVYEYPTPTGWSIYSMLTLLFQENSFSVVLFESGFTVQGKLLEASMNAVPGPPAR